MKRLFEAWGRLLVRNYREPHDPGARAAHAFAAGWTSMVVLTILFGVRLWLGLAAGAISVVAVSFTLLSDLLASVILVISFWISCRPATEKTPFGHGRMEQVAPLLISFVLFFLGIEIARESALALGTGHGHEAGGWPYLPWIILATAVVKRVLGLFVKFLGERVHSEAIEEVAAHLRIEGGYSLVVVAGLLLGHGLHLPWLDATVGLAGSAAIFFLSFRNAQRSLAPLLGQAPSGEFLARIREASLKVPGVSGVHEITVHEYGRMRVVSLHAEIPERYSPAKIHGIAEHLEGELRTTVEGDVIVHADPLMEMTPEIAAVEQVLKRIVDRVPGASAYHDFRVVAHSDEKIIVIADIEVDRALDDEARQAVLTRLTREIAAAVPNLAYPVFGLTSRFSF